MTENINNILLRYNFCLSDINDMKINCNLGFILIIASCICEYYNIDYKDLKSNSRKEPLPFARQIYCYLCKKIYLKDAILSEIGSFIKRDHATVLHSCKQIDKYEKTKDKVWYDFLNIYETIESVLKEYNL